MLFRALTDGFEKDLDFLCGQRLHLFARVLRLFVKLTQLQSRVGLNDVFFNGMAEQRAEFIQDDSDGCFR
jgi:hypothetical protein